MNNNEKQKNMESYLTNIKEYHLELSTLNQKLEKYIAEEINRENKYKGDQHSNIHGWQSERDLHANLTDPSERNTLLLQLFSSFNDPINQYIKSSLLRHDIKPAELYEWDYTGAWFNVAVKGGYNAPHTHPLSQISGAYYVRTEDPSDEHPFSGRIDFFPNNVNRHFFPKPGTLILFPGSMLHFVHPYYGNSNRICLSFNSNNIHGLRS